MKMKGNMRRRRRTIAALSSFKLWQRPTRRSGYHYCISITGGVPEKLFGRRCGVQQSSVTRSKRPAPARRAAPARPLGNSPSRRAATRVARGSFVSGRAAALAFVAAALLAYLCCS